MNLFTILSKYFGERGEYLLLNKQNKDIVSHGSEN